MSYVFIIKVITLINKREAAPPSNNFYYKNVKHFCRILILAYINVPVSIKNPQCRLG